MERTAAPETNLTGPFRSAAPRGAARPAPLRKLVAAPARKEKSLQVYYR